MIMLFLVFHLVIASFMVYMAVVTTDPKVLNKPAAFLACLLWPIVVPAVFVAVQFLPDDPIEDSIINGGSYRETTRLGSVDE